MSHVDEGTIHAWLDGAFAPDDPELERIQAHLAGCETCRRAVEIERRIRERATDVLGAAAPDAVRVEPFQRIVEARRRRERTGGVEAEAEAEAKAKAERTGSGAGSGSSFGAGGAVEAGQGEGRKRGRGFRVPMALAATLVLAIGATWFARQLMPGGVAAPDMEMMDDAGEQDSVANSLVPPAPSPQSPGASVRERSEPLAAQRAAEPPAARDEVAAAEIVPPTVVTEAQVGTTAVASRSAGLQPAPPAAADQRNRTQEETRRLASSMLDSMMRRMGDSAIVLDELVVTGMAVPRPARIADADAVIAVDRLDDAAGTVVWTPADPDTVAARLGMRPLGLTGLDADSVQIGIVGGATVARTVYTVEGQPVELLQWVTGSLNAEAEQFRPLESRQERRVVAGEGVRAREDLAAKAVAPVAPAAFRLEGIDFLLRGGLSADELAALAVRAGRIE